MLKIIALVQAGKPFPEQIAVHYAIKMLYALEILHNVGILHGDVKPDNWLIMRGGWLSINESSPMRDFCIDS